MRNNYFKGPLILPDSTLKDDFSARAREDEAQRGFLKRWEEFCRKFTQFTPWKSDWDPKAVATQFEKLRLLRREVYFTNPEMYEKEFEGLVESPPYGRTLEILQPNRYR